MDGLPLEEDPSFEPRSTIPGLMHACGHDGHMAIVLTLGTALAALGDVPLPGRIVLLFQPAEEGGAGARRVLEEGVLDDFGIDYVLGLHLWSYLPCGVAVVPPGPVMASSDEFRVTLTGAGGHAALPHKANDLVLAVSTLVVALQQIVARNVDPLRPAVLSVGRIRAGEASNVLPDRAEIFGTFRTADGETRGLVMHRIGEIADSIARAHGAKAEIDIGTGYPATVNDPRVAAVVQDAAREVLGPDGVRSGPMTMAAEDFSYLLQARPGVMFLLGMRDEARGLVHPHHSPQFRIADDVLPQGLEIMLRAAVRLMTMPR
jgi:amidohydrolase